MKNNIIIVDLDRTLLHTDKSVSDYTIQTLKKCKNNDMKILVATGRPLRNTTYYHNLINFDSLVLSNGARIITKNKEILNSIDKESAKNIISILNEHNLTITIETLDKAYSNKMINNYESTISNDLNNVIDKNEILKIIIGIENKNTIDLVRKYMTENIYYTIAHEKVIQIMSKNASKFNGISTVLEENNLNIENTIFFGDDNDDIESIKNCNIGVSMSNAIDKVKEASDYTTLSNDEDGVAIYINENILNEE